MGTRTTTSAKPASKAPSRFAWTANTGMPKVVKPGLAHKEPDAEPDGDADDMPGAKTKKPSKKAKGTKRSC